ncbi:MAG: discoidin domain-containing protein [Verrucomicrobia bacterium]|nr:discoidin domain-containing protein [Verrucomicrobiota bacterium]
MQKLSRIPLIALLLATLAPALCADDLERGWTNPPVSARLRAYWWWLNGNVTKAAITRDLEEMKAKGWGGALICDAGGAEQDGNARVKHGPTFFTPEWRALYQHALREADRLGLEMSLNIQSGWNLGGPMVQAEDAPKKLVWSEARATGPAKLEQKLAEPKHPKEFYRDLFVVAFPVKGAAQRSSFSVSASSEQKAHPAKDALDGSAESFWVSDASEPGQGPTRQKPEWLQVNFDAPAAVVGLRLAPRPGYGPRDGEFQSSEDGQTWKPVKPFVARDSQELVLDFAEVRAKQFRIVFFSAFDPRFPQSPRNVQVAELKLLGADGAVLTATRGRGRPLQNWQQKALLKPLHFSAPDTTLLLQDVPPQQGEKDTHAPDVLDLTAKMAADGTLRWNAPAGDWEILRFGCTLNDHCKVSTCSDGWQGYALDPFDAGAFRRYWDAVVEPLIADAGPLAGKALKYLHTDSWEVEVANWTPTLRQEFRQRRGYDLLPFLPVIAGRLVDSRPVSNRFLHDLRRTMGDLAIANHYQLFRDSAHRHGLLIHPESGGPHAVPIDAQQCLGFNDAPMSEFWAWSWRHRVGDSNRFFVKQPASAAHTSGHKLVLAEGFTTIGPHWQETLWDNLKPSFDHALCEGLNLLVWHAFVCSPEEEGLPGIQYFAGTHLNPNVTWWAKSAPFFAYLNRCQWMLQQGLFVADAAYYYGDHVPNFAQLKRTDPARVLPGYDYDVVTEETILTRMTARDGRLVLPDGMSYRLLVLRDHPAVSLPVLRMVKELVAAGATVIGPKPVEATGLNNFPQCDDEARKLAEELWGAVSRRDGETVKRRNGVGRVFSGESAREVLLADGVKPDFEFSGGDAQTALDYIHRRAGDTEIYFVANRSNRWEDARCTFRVSGRVPELWNAVTGERRFAAAYAEAAGRITLPLEFPPYGSMFVVFREPAAAHPAAARSNSPTLRASAELAGPWQVHFPIGWSAPERSATEMLKSSTRPVVLDTLKSWTESIEPGIKYYSGAATYSKSFDLPQAFQISNLKSQILLDLGRVREIAEVRLNGQSLGIVWAPPFRVDITRAVKPTGNTLHVEVVNFWPNRIIGDQFLPAEKRFTQTNVRKLTKDTPLMESGLLGPVRLLEER